MPDVAGKEEPLLAIANACDSALAGVISEKQAMDVARKALGVTPDVISEFLDSEPEIKAILAKVVAILVSEAIPAFRRPATMMRLARLAQKIGIGA